ncbi:helix-turn-helix domain-containing protein [Aquibacillus rhizosphaerae]|uniref:Helix-turn-helix domain-containing protein n=1 Tax=Aquibacillus rhizosphaerae TaxID=3051431 RepID=A0ABT7KZM2_9BACI|nr:helix-turn-helix domain-containing protein [Aquibacillus sp. LR5S19]MDL4838936.1 helix-turn-helix domain-containing protein [Aquibacillus sp. LR5S19]
MLGERLKNERKRKGLSLTKLASMSGISKSYLSYIERGLQKNPSLDVLAKIAVSLDTTIEYLLDGQVGGVSTQKAALIDDEWVALLTRAINEGMSKKDFSQIRDYILFNNWNNKGLGR